MADPGELPGARRVPARPPQTGGLGQAEPGAGSRYGTGGLRPRLGLGEGGGVLTVKILLNVSCLVFVVVF